MICCSHCFGTGLLARMGKARRTNSSTMRAGRVHAYLNFATASVLRAGVMVRASPSASPENLLASGHEQISGTRWPEY